MHRRISNLCQKCTRSASLSLRPCQAPCLSPRPLCSPSSVIVCSSCLCIVSGGSAPPGTAQRRLCCLGCKRWCSAGPADGPPTSTATLVPVPVPVPVPAPPGELSGDTRRPHRRFGIILPGRSLAALWHTLLPLQRQSQRNLSATASLSTHSTKFHRNREIGIVHSTYRFSSRRQHVRRVQTINCRLGGSPVVRTATACAASVHTDGPWTPTKISATIYYHPHQSRLSHPPCDTCSPYSAYFSQSPYSY